MACVVKHAGMFAWPYFGKHVRQHWTQPCPGDDMPCVDPREALIHPLNQRCNAIGANVAVIAVEFSGSCDAEPVFA